MLFLVLPAVLVDSHRGNRKVPGLIKKFCEKFYSDEGSGSGATVDRELVHDSDMSEDAEQEFVSPNGEIWKFE